MRILRGLEEEEEEVAVTPDIAVYPDLLRVSVG